MKHLKPTTGRRGLFAAAMLAAALAITACAPDPGIPDTTRAVQNATFEWTISREADKGAYNGQVNYWSAGQSDSTQATYVPTDGNVTVLKRNSAGGFVPIGADASVSWANKHKDGSGNVVTAFNAFHLGQKVRYANGTGTVNTATGAATIRWAGTFSVNFYGQLVPFWITDPTLTVDAGGAARITATMGGFASSQENPEVRVPLTPRSGVVIAEFANVYAGGSATTGWTSPTRFLGTTVTTTGAPQVAKSTANAAHWGAWPQSFVDFQSATGLGDYWYSSGGAADARKPQDPVTVSYTLAG